MTSNYIKEGRIGQKLQFQTMFAGTCTHGNTCIKEPCRQNDGSTSL